MATSYQDDYLKTALRLPRELHGKIQAAATSSGKSLNSELIARLEQSLSDEPNKLAQGIQAQVQVNKILAHLVAELTELVPAHDPSLQTTLRLIRQVGLAVKDGDLGAAVESAQALVNHGISGGHIAPDGKTILAPPHAEPEAPARPTKARQVRTKPKPA